MKLRQLALAATTLDDTRTTLFELLGLDADFADPGVGEFGLVNSVMAIGDTFLEIVTPSTDNTAAGRMLERRDSTTCGYMALFQVEDFADFDAHLDRLDVRKVWQTERAEVSACHVHPKDIGGAIVSFDAMRPPESWLWGGPDWRMHPAKHVSRILGCTLQSPVADALARRWAEVLDQPLNDNRITMDDGTFVSFVRGDAYEGLSSFTFATTDPAGCHARAAALGLGDTPHIGDLKIEFVPEPD